MVRGENPKAWKTSRVLPSKEVFGRGEMANATLARYVSDRRVRRLARGVYTPNLTDPVEEIVRRNLYQIVALLFPGAVVSDRSFIAGGPTADGDFFLITDRKADVGVGPFTLRSEKGAPPQEDDMPMPAGVFFASPARGLLENARVTRARGSKSARTLTQAELEQWLEKELDARGEDGLRRLREQARALAPKIGAEEQLKQVDALIGAVLGTRKIAARSPLLRARQEGLPYDERRVTLFRLLRDALRAQAHASLPAAPEDEREKTLPFFEAYFSNFIEGTEFPLEEAIEIVYEGNIPASRPQDAYDIIGTYQIVSDPHEMRHLSADADEFLELLRSRHARMLERRPEVQPGVFKQEPNRAGSTLFVLPDRVLGTLVKGFDVYRELPDEPFARAVFIMFLVSEVHPFNDGNGRIARVMMNAELVAGSEGRIIVPQAFRNDYLGALRTLSHMDNPESLPRVLSAQQRFTHSIDFGSLESAIAALEAKNAFLDPIEADFGRGGFVAHAERAAAHEPARDG